MGMIDKMLHICTKYRFRYVLILTMSISGTWFLYLLYSERAITSFDNLARVNTIGAVNVSYKSRKKSVISVSRPLQQQTTKDVLRKEPTVNTSITDASFRMTQPKTKLAKNKLNLEGKFESLYELIQEAQSQIQDDKTIGSSSPVLLATYMRSGSSWLGDITKQAKNSVYFYEPFQFIIEEGYFTTDGVCFYDNLCREPIRKIEYPREVVNTFLNLFKCNIKSLNIAVLRNVMKHSLQYCRQGRLMKTNHFIGMGRYLNPDAAQYLRDVRHMLPAAIGRPLMLYSPECVDFVTSLCLNATQRIVKTIRLSMDLVEILMKLVPNLKVIYLSRDPRAITNSRSHSANMRSAQQTEAHSKALCAQMRRDILVGQRIQETYDRRIKFVLYENLAENPIEEAKKIFDFLGFQFDKDVSKWIHSSAHANKSDGFFGTKRISSRLSAIHWRKELAFNKTLTIQKYCDDVLNALGLMSFRTEEEMTNFTMHVNV